MITLAIVGIAIGSATPLISKTMKNSQVGNFQIMLLSKDIDKIKKDITEIKKNYVTKSYLTEILKDYVTSATLDSKLSDYVTNDTLADYAKTSDLPDLNGYVTSGTLDNYVTAEQLREALANAQGIPAGTIAFFADACPPGWSKLPDTYNGRFPRFAGEYTISGYGDTVDTTTTLNVGTTQEDAIRNITGTFQGSGEGNKQGTGVFKVIKRSVKVSNSGDEDNVYEFNASLVVPTADENRPKSIALLGCKKDPN